MILGTLLISSREWLLPAGGFLVVTLVLLAWTYLRAPADKSLRTSCALLKILGIAALLACLLDPLWNGQRARPGANFFAIVADNSEGMRIKDRGDKHSRGQFLTNLLASPTSGWQDKLEKNFQLRRYVFDARLQSSKDFSDLVFDGRASGIGSALRTIAERFRNQPMAGVLLLTDGNATDLADGKLDTAGLPPIYPIVIGRDDPINDIALQKIAVSQTAFEDAPVTIQTDVIAGGYAGRKIVAQVVDQSGKVVQEQTERAERSGDAFRLQLKPEKSGISFYQVRVSAKDELDQFTKPETSQEATLANNSRVVVVDRGKGPYRILYVGGRPNWEFKFLNRALTVDDQLDFAGLIRVAKREPRFVFRGRIGESSNPLFRGFGDQSKENTEGYDQPVLRWVNQKDESALAGGFPKTAEALFAYSAVILDDLEAEFFTRDQMALLQKFVSERGGGLLMLGGPDSFHQGKYEHTPIGEMLPVYLDNPADGKPPANLKLHLTREGWLQPWARLRNTEADETTRLAQMTPLQVINRVRDVKPGASVIAEAEDDTGKKLPALVAQRFGNGRVGALLIGDLWRWGMHDESSHQDMDKAWRQTARWLIADVPARVAIHAEPKRDDPNQAMTLQVRVRDKEFKPLDNATVKLTVTPVGTTNSIRLAAEPALGEAGRYDVVYVPRESGGYLAETVVTDENGVEVGRAQTGWASDPVAEEFRSLKPNRALLEDIARKTGGEVIASSRLDEFAASLPNRKASITENWSTPLWHRPIVFLFALACFAAEWGMRRWKGLA